MDTVNHQQMANSFADFFQQQPDVIVRAPGRVNLIGEHTDYNNGFVLPAAVNYFTWVAACAHDARTLSVVAQNFDNQQVEIHLDGEITPDSDAPWSNYVRGVVQQLRNNGFQLRGGKLLIAGNIPAGAGLSSSAALEMAVIGALTNLSGEAVSPQLAARMGQGAENSFVGCQCGIMDQLISACGEENAALLIDCQDLHLRPVTIPADWQILVVHSGVKRGLVDSHYNQRRAQCEQAAAFFGASSLRQVTLDQLMGAEAALPELPFRRARHVLTENQRTVRAADLLAQGNLTELAQVMSASHQSMRDDFEITTPEVDTLVEIIKAAGQGEAGARMTGGGFGGCVVAIARAETIPVLIAAVTTHYQSRTGCTPLIIPAQASAGAFR